MSEVTGWSQVSRLGRRDSTLPRSSTGLGVPCDCDWSRSTWAVHTSAAWDSPALQVPEKHIPQRPSVLIIGERGAAFPGIPACKGALKAWGAQVPRAVLETSGLDLPSSMPLWEKLPPGGQGLSTGDPAPIASHQSRCTCSKVGFISIPSCRAVSPIWGSL